MLTFTIRYDWLVLKKVYRWSFYPRFCQNTVFWIPLFCPSKYLWFEQFYLSKKINSKTAIEPILPLTQKHLLVKIEKIIGFGYFVLHNRLIWSSIETILLVIENWFLVEFWIKLPYGFWLHSRKMKICNFVFQLVDQRLLDLLHWLSSIPGQGVGEAINGTKNKNQKVWKHHCVVIFTRTYCFKQNIKRLFYRGYYIALGAHFIPYLEIFTTPMSYVDSLL